MSRVALALVLVLAVALAGASFADERGDGGERVAPPPPPRANRLEDPVLQVQIAPRLAGIAFDGSAFWLSQQGDGGSNPPQLHRLNQQAAIQATFEQTDAWALGFYDIHYRLGYLWGSECWYLRGMGMNGTWPGSPYFMGSAVFSPEKPIAAVAHNQSADIWYTGGEEYLYRGAWNGVDGSTPAWTQITSVPLTGTSGLAFDGDRNCLWLTDGITGTLHKLDPDGGPSLGQIPFLGQAFGMPRGCCLAQVQQPTTMIVLAVVLVDDDDRTDDWLVFWDIEDIDDAVTPVENSSWGSIKALYR